MTIVIAIINHLQGLGFAALAPWLVMPSAVNQRLPQIPLLESRI